MAMMMSAGMLIKVLAKPLQVRVAADCTVPGCRLRRVCMLIPPKGAGPSDGNNAMA